MEPFTINCDTCNSRIRVRNPALLGQLVNCPKCDSIVLVSPPVTAPSGSLPANSALSDASPPQTSIEAGGSSVGPREPQIEVQRHDRPSVDSAALTQEGLPAEFVDASPRSPLTNSAEIEAGDDEYRLAPEMSDAEVADPHFAASSPTPPPIQTADQYVPQNTPPHLPSADWTSDSTTKTQQMLLVGFLGFAGVILAALVFVGFLRWYAKEGTRSVAGSAAATVVPSDDAGQPMQPDGSPNAAPLSEAATTAVRADTGQADLEPPPGEVSAATNDSTDASPEVTPTGSGPIGTAPSEVDAGSTQAADGAIGRPVADNAAVGTDQPGDALDAGQPAVALPKQLQAFGPMLQYEIQPQFSDAMEILSEAPVTAEDLGLTTSTEAVEIPSVDLQAQLQIMIPAMVIGELPLSQFASLWSNLSGIPTAVDLDSLAAAGIDRNQSIGLAMVKSVTLGSLIDQLGAPLGLQAVPRDNSYIELVAPAAMIESHLPHSVSLAGLVDANQEAWLLEVLPQLFPELAAGLAPADLRESAESAESADEANEADDIGTSDDSETSRTPDASGVSSESSDSPVAPSESDAVQDTVSPADGELPEASSDEAVEWKIEQGKLLRPQTASGGVVDPRIWSAAVNLLEGWRHAAGLPAAVANFDPALHSARLVAPSEVVGLDFELQRVQAEARPVAQTVPSICRAAGLQAWMDWPALTSLGLGPNSTALVLTHARPLRRALADYASSFSLVVAVLDGQSLWITSNQAYRTSPRLYVVPSQGESVEAWTSRLRPLTPVAPSGFGVGQVVVIPTPDGKFMLVRCCPMQVEF